MDSLADVALAAGVPVVVREVEVVVEVVTCLAEALVAGFAVEVEVAGLAVVEEAGLAVLEEAGLAVLVVVLEEELAGTVVGLVLVVLVIV